jgi:hypothetical protein
MTETQRWTLPLLSAGQAQKEISHNEALLAIDRVLHLAVVTRGLSQPPADARPGDSFIVGPTAGGDWSGRNNTIASFDGSGWTFTMPCIGGLAWICDESVLTVFVASGWQILCSLARTV